MQSVPVHVRKGTGTVWGDSSGFHDMVEVIRRKPQERKGWWYVNYRNKRYQLMGGTRTPYFICTNRPLTSRAAYARQMLRDLRRDQ
jgi:hypothetical protein